MSPRERYRQLYAYEKDCDEKMLSMLASVSEANRNDARFQRAVNIAAHLLACRENWLSHLKGDGQPLVEWFEEACEFGTLKARCEEVEARWTEYLEGLSEEELGGEFEFVEAGETWKLPTEVQILQLALHAPYHRGQVALLVDQLGGKTVDTDYVDWKFAQE